jgi:glycosyltransferase involved in cell wall biosynthesis
MILGIDASNLLYGGGLHHLVELLKAARPEDYGIKRVVVWSGKATLNALPQKPWLECAHDDLLDGALLKRLYWQWTKLPPLVEKSCDLLFIPGGNAAPVLKPFVTMSRNMLPFESQELRRFGLSWNYFRLLLLGFSQAKSFRNAAGLIFLSEYARSVVMKKVRNLKGHNVKIPHGLDERFRLLPREQKPISAYSYERPFKLLYVSIVSVYKHQETVVEAVSILRKGGLPVELSLIGPAYRPALKKLRKVIARLDPAGSYIHYRGKVPFSQLHNFYHQSDAFVFASSCENLPNILLEAMAAGLPIACSERGPMPEVLKDGGCYFNPEDSQDIARSLRNLILSPSLRQQYAHRAYTRSQQYSWEQCAISTFSFLSNIVEAPTSVKESAINSPISDDGKLIV